MNKFTALLVLVTLAVTTEAATITYKWTYGATSNLLWTNPAAWDGGKVPGPNDNVEIIGDTNDYSGSTPQVIDLGTAAVSVHGLFIDANDVLIKFGGIFTVANFTDNGHSHLKGSVAGATLIVTQELYTDAYGDDNNVWDTIILNVTHNCNVSYWNAGNIYLPHSTFNNMGEWYFMNGGEMDSSGVVVANAQQTFTFNNWGVINFVPGDDPDYQFTFWAKALNNYGTFHIWPGAYVRLAQSDASVISTIFYNYGVFGIEGTFETNDGSPTNLTKTTTLMPGVDNNGTFYLLSYGSQYARVRIDFNFNLPMGTIQLDGGPGRIEGTGSVSVGHLIISTGGIIAGSGPFTVHNLTTQGNTYGVGDVPSQLLRNITVTGFWDQGDGLDIGNSAYFTCSSTCQGLFYTGIFEQLARDNTKTGLINYGVIESYTDVLSYFESYVPTYNYGVITVPDFYTDPTFGGPCGLVFNGGMFTGSLTMFNRSHPIFVDYFGDYEDDDDDSYFTFTGPNMHMSSTVTLHGGQFDFQTSGSDYSYVDPGDYANSAIYWAGRTTPVGDGVIMGTEGVRFIISGPGITWERSVFIGGSIEGPSNLTLIQSRRIDAGYGAIWMVNGTCVFVTANLSMESNAVTFNANGKLIIEPTATLYMGGGLYLDTHVSDDLYNETEGIYNYGLGIFSVDQNDYTNIEGGANFFNYGTLMLNTTISDETEPSGSYFWWQNNIFLQYGSGSIILNVYKAGDNDYVSIFPESGSCYFSGTLHFVFHFTPKAGARFLAAQTQGLIVDGSYDDGLFSCGGLYNITVSGSPLPTGTKAIILYDFVVEDDEEAVNHWLYICPSTNSTCTNYQRNPAYVNRDIPPGFPVITTTASSTTAKVTTASSTATTAKSSTTTTGATSSATTTSGSVTTVSSTTTTATTSQQTISSSTGEVTTDSTSTTTSTSTTGPTSPTATPAPGTTSPATTSPTTGSTTSSVSGTSGSTSKSTTASTASTTSTASATGASTPTPSHPTLPPGNHTGNSTSANSAVTLMTNQVLMISMFFVAAWCLMA